MQELQEIVNAKVAKLVTEGTIQESIEKGIQNAIESAIDSQFHNYGNITKQLEKGIEEGLKINTSDLPFESYNEQMLVAVKTKIGGMFASEASSKFMAELDKTLAPAPKELSINELVNVITTEWKSDDPWNDDNVDEYATVELEQHKWGSTCHSLKMWKQRNSSSFSTTSADIEIYISDGKIRISHHQRYNPTCFDSAEAFIFKAYAAGTTITGIEDFNEDDCELCLKEFDH